jgi:hypothetical protein
VRIVPKVGRALPEPAVQPTFISPAEEGGCLSHSGSELPAWAEAVTGKALSSSRHEGARCGATFTVEGSDGVVDSGSEFVGIAEGLVG